MSRMKDGVSFLSTSSKCVGLNDGVVDKFYGLDGVAVVTLCVSFPYPPR